MSVAQPTVLPLHRMRIYNPGTLTDAEIELGFVARHDVYQRILDEIVSESAKSRPQHHLIVGQRGMGKTTLLLRLAAALRKSPANERFVPLVFAEEQYSVDRLSKFWLNCLDSLADACELVGDAQSEKRIDQAVQDIDTSAGPKAEQDRAAARAALDLFIAETKRLGRRPVLLVDNLQIVFGRVSEQQHDFREVLMRAGAPIVVAASPQLPPSVQDYSAAFYDHFKTYYLRALSLNEMRGVLVSLADTAQRPDIRARVTSHPGRLRALHQLTGGNPRTTVLLFHLYAEDLSPTVYADLEKLLDEVTALYKARFEELSDQMQVVAGAMAEHFDPIDVRTLASATGLPATRISPQLDRLQKLGIVEEVALSGAKRAGYQISERFFNVWYLMRHASRRQRKDITFLTRFLETLYEPVERHRLASAMSREADFSTDRMRLGLSLARSLDDHNMRDDLERVIYSDALRQRAQLGRERLREIIDLSTVLDQVLSHHQLRGKLEHLLGEDLGRRTMGCLSVAPDRGREQIAAAENVSQAQCEGIGRILDDDSSRWIKMFGQTPVDWLSERLVSGKLSNWEDTDDWLRAVQNAPGRSSYLYIVLAFCPRACLAALTDEQQGRIVELLLQAEIDDQKNEAKYWNVVGDGLVACSTQQDSAEEAYRKAIEIDPKLAYPWNGLGNLLKNHTERYEEAEQAYRKAIEIDPKYASPWNGLGNLLSDHTERYEEAEQAYLKAIEIDSKYPYPWNGLGNLLKSHTERYEEAEQAYRKAIEIDPKDASPWNGLGNLLCDFLGRFDEAELAFRRSLELDPSQIIAQLNLVFLLRDFCGQLSEAKRVLDQVSRDSMEFQDVFSLHEALIAAYEKDWQLTADRLDAALDSTPNGFPPTTVDDWIRASAVLIELGNGDSLVELLVERGDHKRLRPWFEAIKAILVGERKRLLNVAPEVRSTAEWFFDQMQRRLNQLRSVGLDYVNVDEASAAHTNKGKLRPFGKSGS